MQQATSNSNISAGVQTGQRNGLIAQPVGGDGSVRAVGQRLPLAVQAAAVNFNPLLGLADDPITLQTRQFLVRNPFLPPVTGRRGIAQYFDHQLGIGDECVFIGHIGAAVDENIGVVDAVGCLHVQLHVVDENLAGTAIEAIGQNSENIAGYAVVPHGAARHGVNHAIFKFLAALAGIIKFQIRRHVKEFLQWKAHGLIL